MTIDILGDQYVEEVAEIEKECFSSPWSADAIASSIHQPYACFYVSLYQGKVVGYIGGYNVADEIDITNVAVTKVFRNRGVASHLLEVLIQRARSMNLKAINLEVRVSNEVAIKIYEKYGFRLVGVRRDFYTRPQEDAGLYRYEIENN